MASSSARHRLFLLGRELGSCSQVPGTLGAVTPDPPVCLSAAQRLSERARLPEVMCGGAVRRTGWQQHRTFLNPQLQERRTRLGLARPLRAGLVLISPGQWCGPQTLAHPEPEECPCGDIPGLTWEEGAEVGTGRARLYVLLRTQVPEPALSSPSCLSLGPWTSRCGCGSSAQYTALKPLPQSP